MSRLWRCAPAVVAVAAMVACKSSPNSESGAGAPSATSSSPPPPWHVQSVAPAAPKGMVWIPPGALVAGTPPGLLPRIADEEMAGEQVILKGFFISIFPFPNEEGAIPLANVTHEQAAALCEEEGKRLCTELEWERACKGPNNFTYEYGNRYRPEPCGTGAEPRMLPSGLRVGCRSDFGVRDLHGALWEWTASPWGRGAKGDLVTVRGGNARAGELVGRCANAMGRPPGVKSPIVGFRCCAGKRNTSEVVVHVVRKKKLERKEPVDKAIAHALEGVLPAEAKKKMPAPDTYRVQRMWYWRPIGNEELVVGGGCSAGGVRRRCGVIVARMVLDRPKLLAWGDSGRYVPTVKTDADPRDLWVYGGDERSHFRRLVSYAWGRVDPGELQRNIKK